MKIVFVHGTGVREKGYRRSLETILQRVHASRPDIAVEGCFWGEEFGARFHAGGISIPDYESTRGVEIEAAAAPEAFTEEETLGALWELLLRDPFFELRLLLLTANKEFTIGGEEEEAEEQDAFRALVAGIPDSLPSFQNSDSSLSLSVAGAWLSKQSLFNQLLARTADPRDLGEVVARALVASAIFFDEAEEPPLAVADPAVRDALVSAVADYLAGGVRGTLADFFGHITKPIVTGFARPLTRLGKWRRGRLMDASSPAAGDILVYQAHGKSIRDYIRKSIRSTAEPVVLLAHSLGGIACVDLLIEQPEPGVKLLITAGSQAPYFHEIGALHSLPFDEKAQPQNRLPASPKFPDWLNIYDPRDFLSFVGDELFGARVRDVCVDNGLPFPDSHSGYWNNDRVWQHIHQRLKSL